MKLKLSLLLFVTLLALPVASNHVVNRGTQWSAATLPARPVRGLTYD